VVAELLLNQKRVFEKCKVKEFQENVCMINYRLLLWETKKRRIAKCIQK
jgi:hypothetical protein